jgi:magnesium transporter
MLSLYSNRGLKLEAPRDLANAQIPGDVVWIDLMNPDPEETAFVERTAKLAIPGRAALSEIETSSRLRMEKNALYVNAPLIYRADSDEPVTTPVGFVLTSDCLITLRFAELSSFTALIDRKPVPDAPALSSGAVFTDLEAIVDRLADVLERSAAELDDLSHRLFHANPTELSRRRQSAVESASLRFFPTARRP